MVECCSVRDTKISVEQLENVMCLSHVPYKFIHAVKIGRKKIFLSDGSCKKKKSCLFSCLPREGAVSLREKAAGPPLQRERRGGSGVGGLPSCYHNQRLLEAKS